MNKIWNDFLFSGNNNEIKREYLKKGPSFREGPFKFDLD